MNDKLLQHRIAAAKKASQTLLDLTARQRKEVLLDLSKILLENIQEIIEANKKDTRAVQKEKLANFIERLSLDEKKIRLIAQRVKMIANFPDELFNTLSERKRPSGLRIKKVIFPLGLIAVIYESRPNVTIDAFALAFKSGNAVLLKGGKEIKNTNRILVNIIKKILRKRNINDRIVTDICALDKRSFSLLLENKQIDCLIPRGGKKLIDHCVKNSAIPMIITGASVVHTYVDRSANLEMAGQIIINAKTRRVSVCNSLDVLLLHRDIAEEFIKNICPRLKDKNVEIRADKDGFDIFLRNNYEKLKKAKGSDFDTEFLDFTMAVKIVDDFSKAMKHISRHSLGHSEAIITENKKQAESFFRTIDAACLYWNTSTQFSDGGEFGMGGEIGISTQKLHTRGPFGYKELTTYKYLAESDGAIRP